MKRLMYAGLVIVLGVLGAFAYSSAQAQPVVPIAVEQLGPRAVFTDDVAMQIRNKLDGQSTDVINVSDPSRIATAKITVQPGAQFPWHTHSGPVFVTVAEGELTYVSADDCVERPYLAGTAFVDPGHGHVHTAFNGGDTVTVLYATFFEVPASGPLTIAAEAPTDCTVGTAASAHAH